MNKTVQLVPIDIFLKALLVSKQESSPSVYKERLTKLQSDYTRDSLIYRIIDYSLQGKVKDLQSGLTSDFISERFTRKDKSIVEILFNNQTNIVFDGSSESYSQVVKLIEELNMLMHKEQSKKPVLKLNLDE